MDLVHTVWFKSSHSDENTACVEVAHLHHQLDRQVALRDSKHPNRVQLTLGPPTWAAFLAAVRAREF